MTMGVSYLDKIQNPMMIPRRGAATGKNLFAALLDVRKGVSVGGRNTVRGRVPQGGRPGHDGVLVKVAV